MNSKQDIPEDLAGFQNIVRGNVNPGDLLVDKFEGLKSNNTEWAEFFVGKEVEYVEQWYRVYRKLAVAKQGEIDHPPAANFVHVVGGLPQQGGVSSKARTDDDSKAPLATLPPAGIAAVAMVQKYGHKKYGDFNNYRKGMEHSRTISCAMRHLMAHMDGETKDPESGELHLAHAACRILFLIQNINDKVDIDDRYKKPTT